MRALVTGGAGFIGSNLALELERLGFQVTVIDHFVSGDFKNLIGFKGEVIAEGVLDVDFKSRVPKPDVVFHQAALTDTTILDQRKMIHENCEGFYRVLEFAFQNKAKVVYASSAGVYGNGPAPQQEHQELVPLNPYGFSKYLMDQLAYELMKCSSNLIVGLRYFNVFGPQEQHKKKAASMIYQLYRQMKEGRRPRIFKLGEQKRDHIYVKDVVRANLLAMDAKKSGVVNVGTGNGTSFNELVVELNRNLGTNLDPDYFDNPYDFYQNDTCADVSLARELLGFKSVFSFRDAVKDYVTWLQSREKLTPVAV